MPISSDDEDDGKPDQSWLPSNRVWRVRDFDMRARHAYELMFLEIPNYPMADINNHADWEITEEYLRERDHEMLR